MSSFLSDTTANYIITRSNPQDLMLAYNVPYFTPGDVEGFLTSVARVTARMKKVSCVHAPVFCNQSSHSQHGDADLDSAARLLLRDWALNIFPYYVVPPKASPNAANGAQVAAAADVLAGLRSRKEMRASGKGLIRFKGSEEDEREVSAIIA